MPIYTGIVKEIGSGNIEGDNSNFLYVKREYIDIGDEHLRKVRLSQYLDDTLVSAKHSGEQVSLSAFSLIGIPILTVSAIKLADGRVRTSESLFLTVIFCLLVMPVMGLLAGFIAFVVLSFVFGASLSIIAGMICAIAYAAHGIIRYLKAKSAF
ncbi:hypothetical protein [Methylophaga muralis]|uniref:Uncharacterized protein n=1 Tax=Methylophaga muralis TaxID=291169 RepID=A0A1E3GP96_9GAMM|nr:hypothetical protein [Methylophaga muralis]ODN65873.1 hypothetical protein A9E74_02395 [Methylophaga muralis]